MQTTGAKEANHAPRCSDGTLSRATAGDLQTRIVPGTPKEGRGQAAAHRKRRKENIDGRSGRRRHTAMSRRVRTQSSGCPIDCQWAEPSHVASSPQSAPDSQGWPASQTIVNPRQQQRLMTTKSAGAAPRTPGLAGFFQTHTHTHTHCMVSSQLCPSTYNNTCCLSPAQL